jgi:hypothetical protein
MSYPGFDDPPAARRAATFAGAGDAPACLLSEKADEDEDDAEEDEDDEDDDEPE